MNEFQNAYQVSQILQREQNAFAIPAGLFAVVEESLAYCQFTDATLPSPNRAVVRLFGSRRIADHVAGKLNAAREDADCGEVGYAVYPQLPRTWVGYDHREDEVPF